MYVFRETVPSLHSGNISENKFSGRVDQNGRLFLKFLSFFHFIILNPPQTLTISVILHLEIGNICFFCLNAPVLNHFIQ